MDTRLISYIGGFVLATSGSLASAEEGGRTCTQSIAGMPVRIACVNFASAVESIQSGSGKYDATVDQPKGGSYTVARDRNNTPIALSTSYTTKSKSKQ